MDRIVKYLVFFIKLLSVIQIVNSHTYSVKVSTESHINVVDSKFLSFTVDPKYLFTSADKYNSKESVCMASALTPAFIRIAGPSTSHLTFHNATITFTDLNIEPASEETEENQSFDSEEWNTKDKLGFKKYSGLISGTDEEELPPKGIKNKRHSSLKTYFGLKKNKGLLSAQKEKLIEKEKKLAVSHSQWKKFVQWANSTGFDLVFALNNEEKTSSGLWDPNTALNILTLAQKSNFTKIFWQLGYECKNQSVDEYLNDLETLRAIVESFDSEWGAVGGDVSSCLQSDSKSDFSDYLTLTDEIMDAVVLDGQSSAQELQRMSEPDRLKLLRRLSNSTTPLWLVDSSPAGNELMRAADWMSSAGLAARNGFAVFFRQLTYQELYEPTLSFYMALLYKNLVGERVLDVDMEISNAAVFAHCTSLRHKPVPGAVTLFGANLDDETARFAVKLSRREEGGDIMQFILGHDLSGNIIINGRAMYEGDIKPIVKRVRPYKTLLLNLPPRSFGFWVIANTRVAACQENEDQDIDQKEFVPAVSVNEDEITPGTVKTKRSMLVDGISKLNDEKSSRKSLVKQGLKERMDNINNNLNEANKYFKNKPESKVLSRRKRQLDDDVDIENKRKMKKFLRNKNKIFGEPKPRLDFIRSLLGLNPRTNVTRHKEKVRKLAKMARIKQNKRHYKHFRGQTAEDYSDDNAAVDNKLKRKRRSIIKEQEDQKRKESTNIEDDTTENDIDTTENKELQLWQILHKIHKQIKALPLEEDGSDSQNTESKDEDIAIVESDDTTRNLKGKTKHGLIKSTVESVVTVLSDLNKNLNRFWNALNLLE